jgi:predicted small integral membrane protein
MPYRTAMFFSALAALVGALGVFAFAGPAHAGRDLFLVFMTLFLALVALRFVLRAEPSESRK